MIHLIAKTNLNGDAISKLNKQYEGEQLVLNEQHEYYVFAIQGNYEIADCIRDCNLVNVTFDEDSGFVILSDNLRNIKLMVLALKSIPKRVPSTLADYFIFNFPNLFNSLKGIQ